jgi:general stress protein 26
MPEYGLAPDGAGEGLLPFAWAVERLERSHNYWLSTVRADGRPHAMAVWAVWLDGALYFSTAVGSRKAQYLSQSPFCVITTERADEAVVMEGLAQRESHEPTLSRVQAVYAAKYSGGYPPDSAVFRVRPKTVFAFIELADRFAKTATRWSFVAE